jgi:hypothetical protein
MMTKKFAVLALATLWFSSWTPATQADVVISNLNGNDGGETINLQQASISKSMGFTMSGGADYLLDSVTLRLNIKGVAVIPVVQIWNNSTSNNPGTAQITLANPTFSSGIANYNFTPSSSFVLKANTTYWLVVNGNSGGAFDWKRNGPTSIVPTGSVATHFGARFNNVTGDPSSSSVSTTFNSYSIQATAVAVPEPSALLLSGLSATGLLVGFWRRRRLGGAA